MIISENTNRIALLGFMGSGKTTIGKLLSNKLGYKFADTDKMIEQSIGLNTVDIFNQKGEAYFRKIETQILNQLCQESDLVIATGGGIPTVTKNRLTIQNFCLSIYLKISPDELLERLTEDEISARPLFPLNDEEVRRLIILREKHYKIASLTIVVDNSTPKQIVKTICDYILTKE